MSQIAGHHHISMITKNATDNLHFYEEILGLRLVKKTVNQEDTKMYHLFYGDVTGSPGTELTFFEIPNAGRTHRGTNAITKIGMFIPSKESLHYWRNRLNEHQIFQSDITTYAGREAIHFEDPDGLNLVLLNGEKDTFPDFWTAWPDSPVPEEHRILGMGPVEMTVQNASSLASTLENIFGYQQVKLAGKGLLYQSTEGHAFGEILIVEQEGPVQKPGKGSVHHLAIRVKDGDDLRYWAKRIQDYGYEVLYMKDRFYFESLYFQDENGIMFELATDGPGFTVDSSIEILGTKLDLPPFLEPKREEIERHLKPIRRTR
ncbi:ring-cleaving dioxygenase [Sporosarcina sp. ACRSL]|uniref:ring-cleaving dioxygenase n=1 Tax=Sporosarcina sp. ACRSL TaxID=2918215 RepID=UPI001EF403CB|nr:ring-cleaving dioxygenase [Sporosarcina sp. ACRSL]MCG7343794.1 ring-cleaving dioxygenase [Sporosarcina sp. ACRSL]